MRSGLIYEYVYIRILAEEAGGLIINTYFMVHAHNLITVGYQGFFRALE